MDAEKSLCWLRGWVSSEAVAHEFYELQRHNERARSCNSCIKENRKCSHSPPSIIEKVLEMKRRQTLKPFSIIIMLAFLTHFTGETAMRPFSMQIFKTYESPIPPDQATTVMSFLIVLANVVFICLVRFTGKRRLYLTFGSGIFVSSFVIACYGFIVLPRGLISFDQRHESFHLDNPNLAYIPMICLFLWSFFSNCGFNEMPWMLTSELFPFK